MPDRGELAYEVLRSVHPLNMFSARAVSKALSDKDITMAMRAVMEIVVDNGPRTVPQMARTLGVARQSVQRLVDEAVSLGYLATVDNPEHRRSRLVALTDSGRNAFEDLHAVELTNLRAMTDDLDQTELEITARTLATLAERIRRFAEPEQEDP
ncbi:MAG TPA: MarR family transcriptional regulator [Actinomycetales bacterium]|nr:MarR family transcriptional regulator [Actinomycetales bacterium]